MSHAPAEFDINTQQRLFDAYLRHLYLFTFLNPIQVVVSPIHLASLLKPKQTCFDQTGYELGALQQIWDRYNAYAGSAPGAFGGQLGEPQCGGLMSRAYHFMCIFIYIHKCPQTNWEESFDLPGGHTVQQHDSHSQLTLLSPCR